METSAFFFLSDVHLFAFSIGNFYLFIYLFIFSCVGSSFHARAFSSCGKRGPLFIVVRGPLFIAVRRPLTITAPPAVGHRLQTLRLSSCGSRAQLLHGMWDLPRPGLEPVSPALAGRFSTTAPPGKPNVCFLITFHLWFNLIQSITGFISYGPRKGCVKLLLLSVYVLSQRTGPLWNNIKI